MDDLLVHDVEWLIINSIWTIRWWTSTGQNSTWGVHGTDSLHMGCFYLECVHTHKSRQVTREECSVDTWHMKFDMILGLWEKKDERQKLKQELVTTTAKRSQCTVGWNNRRDALFFFKQYVSLAVHGDCMTRIHDGAAARNVPIYTLATHDRHFCS